MKKAFIFDLDGTLLKSDLTISCRTKSALREIKERNHIIIISTGRMYTSTMYIIENFLPFLKEYVIVSAYNGGYVVSPEGRIIFEKGVEKDLAIKCVEFLRKLDIHRHIYINDKLISEQDDKEIKDYAVHSFVDYFLVEDLIKEIRNSKHPPLKLLAIGEPHKINEVKFLSEKEFDGKFNIMKSWDIYLDFMPADVSKGTSLKIISDLYNFEIEHCYVFGDSENDIEMLKLTKNSYAMGNSTDEVKNTSNNILPTNDEDGVAYAIEKILADDFNNVNN